MRVYTVAAGQGISKARRWQQCRETVTQLETAPTSSTEIDMAKGILMALPTRTHEPTTSIRNCCSVTPGGRRSLECGDLKSSVVQNRVPPRALYGDVGSPGPRDATATRECRFPIRPSPQASGSIFAVRVSGMEYDDVTGIRGARKARRVHAETAAAQRQLPSRVWPS